MGVFTRMKDIVNLNINAMLDRAEDPAKLAKLMVLEMEDTAVELKANTASAMASRKTAERRLADAQAQARAWEERAQLAVEKGRDDLAREALVRRRDAQLKVEAEEKHLTELDIVIEQHKIDLRMLEDKLAEARDRHRSYVARRAQETTARATGPAVMDRFDELEYRLARSEAEAELSNLGDDSRLAREIDGLRTHEEIDRELEALKTRVKGTTGVPAKKD